MSPATCPMDSKLNPCSASQSQFVGLLVIGLDLPSAAVDSRIDWICWAAQMQVPPGPPVSTQWAPAMETRRLFVDLHSSMSSHLVGRHNGCNTRNWVSHGRRGCTPSHEAPFLSESNGGAVRNWTFANHPEERGSELTRAAQQSLINLTRKMAGCGSPQRRPILP